MLYCLMRKLLIDADPEVADRLREVLVSVDYDTNRNKPECNWLDPKARARIVLDLADDFAFACLRVLDGLHLSETMSDAARLLKIVLGQDIHKDPNGLLHLVRGVAKDRLISTVDTDTRHGRKSTAASRHDGYKGHIAQDPDSEIITAAAVTPANTPDGAVAEQLIHDLLQTDTTNTTDDDTTSNNTDNNNDDDGGDTADNGDTDDTDDDTNDTDTTR